MSTTLVAVRKPTAKERREHNAEVVFEREGTDGRTYTIYGARCYESWEQWGERREILGDNVNDIENWRRSLD